MLRFSYLVVPTGQAPSGGKAETGSRSPLPAIITAVTRLTKSGALSGTVGSNAGPSKTLGIFTSDRCASVISTAA